MIEFTPWPSQLAERYRQKGYWLDKPLSDILDIHADNNDYALICGNTHWRYSELYHASIRLAAALKRRGAHQGQTALVHLGNVAEFYLVFFALMRLGVIPVNALFNHQRHELSAYASQIKPSWLFADRQHPLFENNHFLNQLKADYPKLQSVFLNPQHQETELVLTQLSKEKVNNFVSTPTPADQVAFFQLSGGSTGKPKLIPRTHNDYYYSTRASAPLCAVTHQTRYLCALPIAHNYPMSSPGALGIFYAGGRVILASDPSPESCFPLIEQQQITLAALVPSAVNLWLENLRDYGKKYDFSSLTLLLVGGAPFSETLARRVPKELNCQLQQVFGMAEGFVSFTRLTDDDTHIYTTQGCPLSEDDEVWVADIHTGTPLSYGQAGLLMTRGPYTFRGYYHSPEQNRRVFDNQGFYCSGDIVIQQNDGYLQVVGREKDQINRGGEKIAAEEIEHLLSNHPAVLDVALVAMPDNIMGEKSCAYIVSREPIKGTQLRRWLREQGIAEFKLPDHFKYLPALPLTPIGKINKSLLRKQIEMDIPQSDNL